MIREFTTLIEKFLSDNISEDEMQRLLYMYQQKKIREKQLDGYYTDKWRNAGEFPSPIAKESEEKIWKQLQRYRHHYLQTIPYHKNRWIAVSSAVAIAVLFFVLGFWIQQEKSLQKELVITVENGQKATVELPDGSFVWLNSASELRYAPNFGKKKRTVKLQGEAYFEVQSNPNNPFIVETDKNLRIKALGTKFNIKSYPNDEQITSTLIEGKIEVITQQLSETLHPFERVSFHTIDKIFNKSHIEDVNEAIYWKTNQLLFEKETLANIAKILERMYNVTISFTSPEIKEIQYSGKIINNSLENVLNLITVVSPLDISIAGSQITFSKKEKV